MSEPGIPQPDPKHAWRDLPAQSLPKRSASERAADFLEIHGLFDEATAREQASRCIQCPNPTCVSGCPLCNPIPQWMQLTAEGRFLEAAAVLGSATSMAEICTRVCPSDRLCEGACILDSVSEPVSIQSIERFLIDYAFRHGQVDASTEPPNGLKVAVVGSGPGGLACADELARRGYDVTVFDSAFVPGGLLVNGTPAFKLDQSFLQRRMDIMQTRGVTFRLGVELWEEVTLSELAGNFDAVYLGFDWRRARVLEIPGAETVGVVPALPFLLQKTTPAELAISHIEVENKTVVVIGGGDTAMDCLRTAIRWKAKEVICVYRRSQTDMPCSRVDYAEALEEGARFMFQVTPVAVVPVPGGGVAGLRLARTLPRAEGETAARILPGTEFDLPADLIIPALGFEPMACPQAPEFASLKCNSWGGIQVDDRQRTNLPGVFAGGDITRGPSTVLHAVRDARIAAEEIHAYLSAAHQPAH